MQEYIGQLGHIYNILSLQDITLNHIVRVARLSPT